VSRLRTYTGGTTHKNKAGGRNGRISGSVRVCGGVDLRDTQVTNLSPLAELTSLEWLNLNNTQVSDLSPLVELKNLEGLGLHHTQVSDLSPLAELKNLERLNLNNTQVSNGQVQKLRLALPNCEIER